ncbi:MAG: PaaI family thioesterase [Anaerolineae bacterium]
MNIEGPGYDQTVQDLFDQAAFVADLGIKLHSIGLGWCETRLEILPRHLQQDRFIHAGVQATMADHTAGAAAGTLMQEGQIVLTVEFKINLLRPAVGESLRCRGTVLKPGRTLTVAESEVWASRQGQEKLVAKATVTLALVTQA